MPGATHACRDSDLPGTRICPDIELQFDEYKAPRNHLDCLVRPPLQDAGHLVDTNQSRWETYPDELKRLRTPARRELRRDAIRYTSAYRDGNRSWNDDAPIVMAGHQPTLFHPGVWFKNFALDHLATQTDSVAVNLVVDSDVSNQSSIRVPVRHSRDSQQEETLGWETTPYDQGGGGVPFEQALIRERRLFDRFDQSVKDALQGLVDQPSVVPLWQYAREAINRCGYAGCALAQARHRLESDLGLRTFEIPQSVVCRSESFATFAMTILSDLPRFHCCYNESAGIYRKAHGIRSVAHPVPDLGQDGDWYEAPFWVYGNQSPQRRGLWVRQISAGSNTGNSEIELSDRQSRTRRISVVDVADAAESFHAMASPEFKIRSRALVTTMYARLVLSDLFLHGIGGGKYDQLGDLIGQRFWGIESPEFMVLSATLLLPGHESHSPQSLEDQFQRLQRMKRDLEFQPERFAEYVPADLIASKRELLFDMPPRRQRKQWHESITKLNHKMTSHLDPLCRNVDEQLDSLHQQRRQTDIWNSREHSFVVFPLEELTRTYRAMLSVHPASG